MGTSKFDTSKTTRQGESTTKAKGKRKGQERGRERNTKGRKDRGRKETRKEKRERKKKGEGGGRERRRRKGRGEREKREEEERERRENQRRQGKERRKKEKEGKRKRKVKHLTNLTDSRFNATCKPHEQMQEIHISSTVKHNGQDNQSHEKHDMCTQDMQQMQGSFRTHIITFEKIIRSENSSSTSTVLHKTSITRNTTSKTESANSGKSQKLIKSSDYVVLLCKNQTT